jgi:hypothetical protein
MEISLFQDGSRGDKGGGGGDAELLTQQLQGAVDSRGIRPLCRVEPLVPTAHGQPVGFADDGAAVQLSGKIHQGQQACDDHALLVILLAHKEVVRADDAQQPVHDLTDTLKMPRAVLAFKNGFKGAKVIVLEARGSVGVEPGDPGQEKDIDTGLFQQGDIFFEGNGIFLEIFRVVELGGVDVVGTKPMDLPEIVSRVSQSERSADRLNRIIFWGF